MNRLRLDLIAPPEIWKKTKIRYPAGRGKLTSRKMKDNLYPPLHHMLFMAAFCLAGRLFRAMAGRTGAAPFARIVGFPALFLPAMNAFLSRFFHRSYAGIRLRVLRLTLPKHPAEAPPPLHIDRPVQRRQKSHTRYSTGYGFGMLGRKGALLPVPRTRKSAPVDARQVPLVCSNNSPTISRSTFTITLN